VDGLHVGLQAERQDEAVELKVPVQVEAIGNLARSPQVLPIEQALNVAQEVAPVLVQATEPEHSGAERTVLPDDEVREDGLLELRGEQISMRFGAVIATHPRVEMLNNWKEVYERSLRNNPIFGLGKALWNECYPESDLIKLRGEMMGKRLNISKN
jgi:hypothetical protein